MIVVCGETLIDLVPAGGDLWRALPGGSPANAAVALARLRTPTAMLARISGDPFGGRLRQRLADNDVDSRYVVSAPESTTLAIVDLDDAGGARYTFHLEGTADWQWHESELPADFGPDVTAIHAGSMALVKSPGGPVLEAMLARERDRRVISIDPNVRTVMCPDPLRYREIVERWVAIAHIVKASVDDLGWLYPDRPHTDVLAEWSTRGPALVVATLGADGAVARTAGGNTVEVPGVEVDVVDTIGAGDTFSAALLHTLDASGYLDIEKLRAISDAAVEAALQFAVRVAAVTCTRAGADPPYLEDLSPGD